MTSPSGRTRQSLLLVPQSRDEDQRLDEDANRSHIGAAPPPIRPFGNTYTNQQSVQNRNPSLNSARLQNAKFGRFAGFHTESIERPLSLNATRNWTKLDIWRTKWCTRHTWSAGSTNGPWGHEFCTNNRCLTTLYTSGSLVCLFLAYNNQIDSSLADFSLPYVPQPASHQRSWGES